MYRNRLPQRAVQMYNVKKVECEYKKIIPDQAKKFWCDRIRIRNNNDSLFTVSHQMSEK